MKAKRYFVIIAILMVNLPITGVLDPRPSIISAEFGSEDGASIPPLGERSAPNSLRPLGQTPPYEMRFSPTATLSLTSTGSLLDQSTHIEPAPTYGLPGEYDEWPSGGHQWIIMKAIEYLEQKANGLAKGYVPLDDNDNLWQLYQGVYWADPTVARCGIKPFVKDDCDAIHHYGKISPIKASIGALGPVNAAHPGGFAAPYYAQILYDQAIKFWPGGDQPNLSELPYKDAGWFWNIDLKNTYVGGLPFCEKIAGPDQCPRWPIWATGDDFLGYEESASNAMWYLGWALHLIQDLTIPYHACNQASWEHKTYESSVKQEIKAGIYDHLPVAPGGSYQSCDPASCPVYGNYYFYDWDPQQYADAAREITNCNVGWIINTEIRLDLAIKLTAGVIEKYFAEISLPPDQFEYNDVRSRATDMSAGHYTDLTLAHPGDLDWYKIHVEEDYSDIGIDIRYSRLPDAIHPVAVLYFDGQYFSEYTRRTSYGRRAEVRSVLAGDYYLKIYLPQETQSGATLLPVQYNMTVAITEGALPTDSYEPNDRRGDAAEFPEGCEENLTIHDNTDWDYYYLNMSPGYRFTASVEFDPAEGELEITSEHWLTHDVTEDDNSKMVRVSGCPFTERAPALVTGGRNFYTLCMNKYQDPSCEYQEISGVTTFCFETEVELDNVFVFTFRHVAGGADTFILPEDSDTDDDRGKNIPSGTSCLPLRPVMGSSNQNLYVVTGTTDDETHLVVSSSIVDLTGIDFDTMFPEFDEFGMYGGPWQALMNFLEDGMVNLDIAMEFDDAGDPDGLLLTPFGSTTTLYRFSSGEPIGSVTASELASLEIPEPYRTEPDIFVYPTYILDAMIVGTPLTPEEIIISNVGTADLNVQNISLSDTINFSLNMNGGSNPCGSTTPTIPVNSSCTLSVTFNLSSVGTFIANLTVDSDDPDTPSLSVVLDGHSIPPPTFVYLPLIIRNFPHISSWQEVPIGSATAGGISDNNSDSVYPAVAIAPDGTPYVAWQDDNVGNTEIYVQHWNGSEWEEVCPRSASNGGISDNEGNSIYPSVAITDGTIYIAWEDDSSGNLEIYVRRWNGSTWEEVGVGSAMGGGVSNNSSESHQPSIAVAPDGTPYVAWHDYSVGAENEVYVRRWNGSIWEEVGAGSASGRGISNNDGRSWYADIAIAPDGTPYVVWHDHSSEDAEIYVRRWNGNVWEEVGDGSASGGGISNNSANSWTPSIAIAPDGTPYVAWHDHSSGNAEIYVRHWNGSSWEAVGTGSASGGGISDTNYDSKHPSLVVTPNGTPYVAWYDWSSGSALIDAEIYVRRWNENSWEEVGANSASDGGISDNNGDSKYPVMAVSPDGIPYVVWYDDSDGDNEIYVLRWQ